MRKSATVRSNELGDSRAGQRGAGGDTQLNKDL